MEKNVRNTAKRRKIVTTPVPVMSMTELARLGGGKVADRRLRAVAGKAQLSGRGGGGKGKSGGEDRLLILYNETRFELVATQEIGALNPDNRVRAPLVAQLKSKTTRLELLFMVNHLYRGSDSGRRHQSDGLNRWGPPIIHSG